MLSGYMSDFGRVLGGRHHRSPAAAQANEVDQFRHLRAELIRRKIMLAKHL
jgi:hypothetical protein